MATFVRTGITWSAVKRSLPDLNIEWLVTEVQETTIMNVYKPPPSELYTTSLPSVPAPAIYAGDFYCQHTDWGYKQTTKDGETLSDWASSAEAVLRYDPKEPRASSLNVSSPIQPIAGKPVKRWNFRKANWELLTAENGRKTPGLPNPQAGDADGTYTAYCNMLICAAKKNIPRGFNKHYIPGWDDNCNHLLREHQQTITKEDIDTTATALLKKLDEVRRARWTEVVESVDFTHSSRKAWQTINKHDALYVFAHWTSREVTSLSKPATADAICRPT